MKTLPNPNLRIGDHNLFVSRVKATLRSQGLWSGTDSEVFGSKLKAAVQYFQSTHIGPDGQYLDDDGIIGPDTWWALYNPSGEKQRSNILPDIDRGFYGNLVKTRKNQLKLLFKEHASNIREIPDGSNGGDGVEKYIVGFGNVPWCCLAQSWAWKEVTGLWPLGKRYAHVQTFWNEALDAGIAYPKDEYSPVPGDLLVWRFSGGTGHISCCVSSNEAGSVVNTIGGNEGNRMKLGTRVIEDEPRLAGYINLHGDASILKKWEKRIFTSSSDRPFGSGNTR